VASARVDIDGTRVVATVPVGQAPRKIVVQPAAPGAGARPDATVLHVDAEDYAFHPASLAERPGTTLTWMVSTASPRRKVRSRSRYPTAACPAGQPDGRPPRRRTDGAESGDGSGFGDQLGLVPDGARQVAVADRHHPGLPVDPHVVEVVGLRRLDATRPHSSAGPSRCDPPVRPWGSGRGGPSGALCRRARGRLRRGQCR
jgi:hypothetical protein